MKSYDVTAKISFRLKDEDIEDIIITALNGGIGYWACLDNSRPEYEEMGKDDCVDAWTGKILNNGGTVYLIDEQDEDIVYGLTIEDLINGIKSYVENGLDVYGVFGNGSVNLCNLDAASADTIVQLAVFGDVVYG